MTSNLQMEQKVEVKAPKFAKRLHQSSRALFAIAITGQMMFVYYIVAFYGGIAVSGQYEKVNEQLGHGIMEGDPIGNAMLAIHIFLAAVITFGGPLQFSTALRNRFPKFHRWNGRIYYVTAFIVSFAGLYMNATRGAHGGFINSMGNFLNASLIMGFSVMAWRTAMQRKFMAHKKWALRAFLMVSGVWFFRIGYGLWLLLTGFSGIGVTSNLTGPFDRFLSYGHSLVPLLILELYFFAKAHPSFQVKKWTAAFLTLLCLFLVGGIAVISMIFWIPALH
ncbi:MAG: DUF2306 domain-containing protein [Saprospiraceae bacterium]|nr:DUF2306 domain-containing protein [Saprospiraceae bacterium]